tara:strand:+ start:1301 stop:2632 length:1332 start_codon:yes stop_codon:yes gene_type:complete
MKYLHIPILCIALTSFIVVYHEKEPAKNEHENEIIHVIPKIMILNGKDNFLHIKENIYTKNINRISNITNINNIIFFDDTECLKLILKLEEMWGMQNLSDSYTSNTDGRIKSDMCRLAMLHEFGGFYFDNDIFLVENILEYISPMTEFVTCKTTDIFKNPSGFFQAFIGSTPQHELLKKALFYHALYYLHLRNQTIQSKPNVGTVLLRDAFVYFHGELFTKRLANIGFSYKKRMQLFVEDSVNMKIDTIPSNICHSCDITQLCDFGVFDPQTERLVFKSRIFNNIENITCPVYCGAHNRTQQKCQIKTKSNIKDVEYHMNNAHKKLNNHETLTRKSNMQPLTRKSNMAPTHQPLTRKSKTELSMKDVENYMNNLKKKLNNEKTRMALNHQLTKTSNMAHNHQPLTRRSNTKNVAKNAYFKPTSSYKKMNRFNMMFKAKHGLPN